MTKLRHRVATHVLAGKASAAEIWQAVQRGNGIAHLKTVNGEKLTAVLVENRVKLKDGQGREAEITRADVNQINGVIHVIDTVLILNLQTSIELASLCSSIRRAHVDRQL
jgi:uncharacterized surface protein with fasciclin (FAS1) repeats